MDGVVVVVVVVIAVGVVSAVVVVVVVAVVVMIVVLVVGNAVDDAAAVVENVDALVVNADVLLANVVLESTFSDLIFVVFSIESVAACGLEDDSAAFSTSILTLVTASSSFGDAVSREISVTAESIGSSSEVSVEVDTVELLLVFLKRRTLGPSVL